VGKAEEERPLGRPRCRWVNNIKMELRDRIDLTQKPVEGSCEHGNEHSGSIKCWEVLEWLQNGRLLKKGSAL
jgi:hypothetical protein